MALYSIQEVTKTLSSVDNLKKWSIKDGRKTVGTSEAYSGDLVVSFSDCCAELKPGTYELDFKIGDVPCTRKFEIVPQNATIAGFPQNAHLQMGYNQISIQQMEDKHKVEMQLLRTEWERDEAQTKLVAANATIERLNQKIDDLTDDDDDDEAGKEKVDINAAINGFINHFIPKPAGTPTALAPPVVQGVSANPREAQTDLQAALQKLKNRFPNKRLSAVINHFITLSNSPLYKALIDTEIAKL